MKPAAPLKTPTSAVRGAFPIVGLGASAGGLEALEIFLKNVPAGSGLVFVVVQHLDPTHTGMLPELLQRSTVMKVIQVKDRKPVAPDCVYVIPPNKDLSLLHGVLYLFTPSAPRGLRLPIDFFFRSLAEDQQERSVGVIRSGMGTDGTLGLRAIKEHAGVTLVQEPASARFDGMPLSAIKAQLADIVGPAEQLPALLLQYLQHTPRLALAEPLAESGAESHLEKIFVLLRNQTAHDFSLYKRTTVLRRIERRMGLHQIARMGTYVRYLRENPQEAELLFKELLIGVTSFFRDPTAWHQLRDELLPPLLANQTTGRALRAWVPGCSTGEEAYSLAMVFKEALDRVKPRGKFSLQLYATDLDRDAVDKARQGSFPLNIAADVSPERLQAVFRRGRARLPRRQGDSRDGHLRPAEPHHGSAFHQAGHPVLPQPGHLPQAGIAAEIFPAVPLQHESARCAVPQQRGKHRRHHELEVHQIELEIQNDELLSAQAEIEAGLERYTDLYDFAPVGYLNLTSDGTIKLANFTAAKLVQIERARLLDRRFGLLVAGADRPAFNEFLAGMFASGAGQSRELAMDVPDRKPLKVSLEATLTPDGQECRVVLTDITVRLMQQEAIMNLLAEAEHEAKTKGELLSEVNHRVTNNLCSVLGLMGFESSNLKKDEPHPVAVLLQRLDRRIRGMIHVHQMLSRLSWAPVRLETMAKAIIAETLKETRSDCPTVVTFKTGEQIISPRQAGALALVLSELAHNSVKYAGQPAGEIAVGLEAEGDSDWITLRYRDNGPGYPPEVLGNEWTNVGLKLCAELVQGTLRGTITLTNDNGAVATLSIRREEDTRT